jgi:hypothetical protein
MRDHFWLISILMQQHVIIATKLSASVQKSMNCLRVFAYI